MSTELGTRDQQPFWETIVRVPAQDVKEHPENPRRGNVQAIADMIQANGWHGVLVVQQSTGYILVGNHRYRAGLQIGMDTFPVMYMDIDHDQALRILLADNRATDIAEYDDPQLLRLVAQAGDADTAVAVLANPDASREERMQAMELLKNSEYRGTGYRVEDAVQMALELAPDPVEGVPYRDPESMQDTYDQTSVRQIMLIMNEEEYALMVPALRLVRQRYGVETNTDALMALLDKDGFLEAVRQMERMAATTPAEPEEEQPEG